MNPHDYQKVKAIFQEAVELSPTERAQFLDEKCGSDENLRFQVERLLKNEDSVFLEEPLIAQMAEAVINAEYAEDLADFLAECESDGYFSHYKIIKKIGQGGMGEVYLADDTRLDRKVAIKVLSKQFSRDEERLKRFIREAKSASALNHPNIITVFETREQKDIYYVVNEFVDGETLAEKISDGPIALLEAVKIAIQIASALAAAHEAGIIHRDIKPDNVMVRRDGIVKVLDFGLATTTEISNNNPETFPNIVTAPGIILGTPQYMSPEQAGGKKADARSDIFSFGILFYELVTGKSPFKGKNQIEVLASILKEHPPPVENFTEEKFPDNLKRIIDKTLRKDPEKRYQNAKNLLTELDELKDELKFESKLSQKIERTHSEAVARKTKESAVRRQRNFYFSAALLLLAVAVAGAVWFLAGDAQPERNNAGNSYSVREAVNWSSSPGELFSTGTFAPDGKTVAFSSTRSGKNSIWIKQTNAGDPVQVTKDEFENKYPVFSPDSDEIAFISNREGENGIRRIPALGGSSKLVTNLKDAGAILKVWSKSGKIFYESEHNLFAFDTKTNEAKRLTDFEPKNESVHRIALSLDEKRIAYVINEAEKWKISVRELGHSDASEVIAVENKIDAIIWHPDDKRLLYSSLTDGVFQIFVIGVGEKKATQITFGEKDAIVQDISADGKKILFGSAKEDSTLWYADIERSKDALFSLDLDSEMWQTVSPDNQTVVFQSIKNLSQANKLLNGAIIGKRIASEVSPVRYAEDGFLPKFSADGKNIAYLKTNGETTELWTVKSSGGNPQRLAKDGIDTVGFTLSPYNLIETAYYAWSPVGNTIAYISDRGDGANIRLVAVDDLSDEKLTDHRGDDYLLFSPIWSSDGKRIAYYSVSNKTDASKETVRTFWIYNRETKEKTKVHETTQISRLIGFSENEKALVYASAGKFSSLPPEVSIYAVSLENGETKLLYDLKDVYYYNIQLSPDRAYLAFVSRSKGTDAVLIVPTRGGMTKILTDNNNPRLYFSGLSWSPDGKNIFFGKQTRFTILSMIEDFK